MQITKAERDQLRERHASLTEAELDQLIGAHRLIIDNLRLVRPIAARYARGGRFEYEELFSEGTVGLVVAARTWRGEAEFTAYARLKICGAILDFIKKQLQCVPHSGDETELHLLLVEWKGGAVIEGWTKLPSTPERIAGMFETIWHSPHLKGAWRVLSKRERRMVQRHLTRKRLPRMLLAQVAREEAMSYRKAMVIVRNSIRKLHAHIKFRSQKRKVQFPIAYTSEGVSAPSAPFLCPPPFTIDSPR